MKRKISDTLILIIALAVFILAMAGVNGSQFFKIQNIQSMAFQMPELGILSLAMMIAMLTGGINLSIISSANLTSIVIALFLSHLLGPEMSTSNSYFSILAAIGAGLVVSILIGLLNGFLIAYIEVSPILATLGTMILIKGVSIVITKGYVISGFPPFIRFIGNGELFEIPSTNDHIHCMCSHNGIDTNTNPVGNLHPYAWIKCNRMSLFRH